MGRESDGDGQSRAPHGGGLLLQTARAYAVCAAKAADAQERRHYTELAIGAVRTATGDDFQDLMAIKTDPDLVLLRDEPAWQSQFQE